MPTPTRRLLLALPLLLPWPRKGRAEGLTLEALLARLAARPERHDLFREERRFAALEEPLESSGTLSWQGGRLEKRTLWPQPELLQVEGDRLVLTVGNEPPRVIDLAAAPELRTLVDAIRGPLSGDAAALRRAFRTTVRGSLERWGLELAPADPAAAALLRTVRLEGHGDQVDRVTLVQANGDTQAMTVSAP